MPAPSVEDPEPDRSRPSRGATFVLLDRTIDVGRGRASFSYDLDGEVFREELRFPPGGDPGDPDALRDLLDLCHIVIGCSYFKLRAPTRLVVTQPISAPLLEVCRQTYDQGLHELAVTNGLDLPLATEIEAEVKAAPPSPSPPPPPPLTCRRPLVPVGGGKDSAAVLGLLPGATGISISATAVQRKLAAAAGVELLEVDRQLDAKLSRLTPSGYNGHIPITAINSAISSLVAHLFGYDCVVMGNERSASEPTHVVAGVPVNHQHSKSFEFETALHDALGPTGINYFSLLRQLSELAIAGIVSRDLRLRGSFLSCNRAFLRSRDPEDAQVWCLECPKCLFTFLCFAPFLTLGEADEVFGGNPLRDPAREDSFRDLWRPDSKPFDCVGERTESAAAMAWLGRRPGWCDLAVVRALMADADATTTGLGADVDSVLAVGGPHLIPAEAPRPRRRRRPGVSPVQRADLTGRTVVLLGLGVDMAATLDAIVGSEPGEAYAVDADAARARGVLAGAGLGHVAVFEGVDGMPPADVAVRSPGFPLYSAALQDRVGRGLETVTPLGLWLAERGDRPTVALTGTKGKSTVSVLTTLALEHLGQRAVTVGNIGIGPWTLPPAAGQTVVIEVSSYQAADLGCTPSIAALTSIGEDHLDWHGSVDRYQHDKASVFTAPGLGDRRWAGVLADVDLPPAFAAIDFCRLPVPAGGLRARNAHLAAAAALAVGHEVVDPAQVEELAAVLLQAYPELRGRFRLVATVDSVRYVDDALASNPLGLAASIGEVGPEPLTLVVGGADRGADLSPVLAALARRAGPTHLVCIDDSVALEARYAVAGATTHQSPDLEAAVRMAAEITPRGGVVVFSPGMPTPPAEGNWTNRSARFQAEVERLAT